MNCPFCQSTNVVEEKATMIIQQGLNRITSPADNYRCNDCKRTFISKDQRDETNNTVHSKRNKIKMEDLGTRKSQVSKEAAEARKIDVQENLKKVKGGS